MKILLAAAEVAPIIKIGGLGDVAASLPKALEKLGVNVDVIAPYFPFANIKDLHIYKSITLEVPFSGEVYDVDVFKTKLPNSNVDVLLLKNDKYFLHYGAIGKITDVTELETFGFFCKSVVEYIKSAFNTYDLIHCNDWHTGMITHLLQDEIPDTRPATLFTIHNLLYQGVGTPGLVRKLGINPGEHPLIEWDISDGDVNFMQQGITSCDYINAVSPTYAKEILTSEYGGNFYEILQAREGRLVGILNGLDYSTLPRTYTAHNVTAEKLKAKKEMCSKVGVKFDDKKPVFAYIGRLDPYQKGLDILMDAIPHIIAKGGQFVIQGDGNAEWKDKLLKINNLDNAKGNYSAQLIFDSDLARTIYAGVDYLLVPSRYEPCGLIQMIAMWYGTLPIVRATGGLKDSVKDGKNGLVFDEYSSQSLINAVDKAFDAFSGHKYSSMVLNAINSDFSWDKSAEFYKELYERVIKLRMEVIHNE